MHFFVSLYALYECMYSLFAMVYVCVNFWEFAYDSYSSLLGYGRNLGRGRPKKRKGFCGNHSANLERITFGNFDFASKSFHFFLWASVPGDFYRTPRMRQGVVCKFPKVDAYHSLFFFWIYFSVHEPGLRWSVRKIGRFALAIRNSLVTRNLHMYFGQTTVTLPLHSE